MRFYRRKGEISGNQVVFLLALKIHTHTVIRMAASTRIILYAYNCDVINDG